MWSCGRFGTGQVILMASRRLLRGFAPVPVSWKALLRATPDNISVSIMGCGRRSVVTATRPSCKGRRGGSSILRPKPSPSTKPRTPGAGKKKKPKVHGEPFSRIAKDRRDEEKAKKQAERLKDVKWDENMPPFEV